MAKKRKPMSAEARKAASERMKAYHEAIKKQKANKNPKTQTEKQNEIKHPDPSPDGKDENITQDDYQALKRQIDELKANQPIVEMLRDALGSKKDGAKVTEQGIIGETEKFSIDPAGYPDPRDRLADEQKLQRFAFRMNYELGWQVTSVAYTTIDNRRIREPKFTLELIRILLDEKTGQPTNKRYVVCRGIFHEDPDAAIAIANENGLPVDKDNQKEFLNEMRYLRFRDWLLESFYPPQSTNDRAKKRQMVIDNKLVEVYTVNSEQTVQIPWDKLKKAKL